MTLALNALRFSLLILTLTSAVAGAKVAADKSLLTLLGLSETRLSDQLWRASPLLSDTRLSASGTLACTSCHNPAEAWSSTRIGPAQGGRDGRAVPSLYSAGAAHSFFWDGRATTLEAQVMEVLENPSEMGLGRLRLAQAKAEGRFVVTGCEKSGKVGALRNGARDIGSLTRTQQAQVDAYFYCVAHALADAVRAIELPSNPWSDWGRTGRLAISLDSPAYRGALLFVGRGKCVTCHYGPNFSDGEFHNIGIGDLKAADISDPGRFGGAQQAQTNPYNRIAAHFGRKEPIPVAYNVNEEMWGSFKTPSLVSASKRGAFMHNGKLHSLQEVVHYYNTLDGSVVPPHHYNGLIAPIGLTSKEEMDLVAFLETL